ncbi:MAG: FHA domain-containing protein [Myxococcota bacterium]
MATLLHVSSAAALPLRARSAVGRAPGSHVCIRSKRTSGEHALITFNADLGWTVRDLGSRNGTLVDGTPLGGGVRAPLNVGTELCFGEPSEVWRVQDLAPPAPMATDGNVWVQGEDGLLGVPDLEDPALIIEGTPRGWMCGDASVGDGQVLTHEGQSWTLHLPTALSATAAHGAVLLERCTMRCAVSADEEFIQVQVGLPGGAVDLPARSHHEVLLMLARRRLEDAADSDLASAEHGWMYRADLQKALRASANQVYIGLHRIRKEFEGLGIVDGHDVIETRRTTRQVRLAISDLNVRSLS